MSDKLTPAGDDETIRRLAAELRAARDESAAQAAQIAALTAERDQWMLAAKGRYKPMDGYPRLKAIAEGREYHGDWPAIRAELLSFMDSHSEGNKSGSGPDWNDKFDALRSAAAAYLIHADHDFPGDAPVLCGYTCALCRSAWGKEDEPQHEPGCLMEGVGYMAKPLPDSGSAKPVGPSWSRTGAVPAPGTEVIAVFGNGGVSKGSWDGDMWHFTPDNGTGIRYWTPNPLNERRDGRWRHDLDCAQRQGNKCDCGFETLKTRTTE